MAPLRGSSFMVTRSRVVAARVRFVIYKNDYDKEVYNGDIGYIEDVEPAEGTLTAAFDGRTVTFEFGELDTLVPAYAATIHKSQGSEYPAVVIPVMTQHYTMLQRNLFYTAITRARKLCVLAGNPRAINMAVRNNKVAHRFTALEWRLNIGKVGE